MVYGCGNNLVKIIVFIANLILFIAGVAVVGTGIWANTSDDLTKQLQELIHKLDSKIELSDWRGLVWVLVGVGAFVMIVAFLGCCGAAFENRIFLGLYFFIILTCFLAELILGIMVLVRKGKIEEDIKQIVKDANKDSTDGWLKPIQDELNCCGTDGMDGYKCKNGTVRKDNGCGDAIWDKMSDYAVVVGWFSLGTLIVEIVAMLAVCCLCQAIGKGEYGMYS